MNEPLFECSERWPGAPKICVHANLPAFADWETAEKFRETNCPGCQAKRRWICGKCHHIHFLVD